MILKRRAFTSFAHTTDWEQSPCPTFLGVVPFLVIILSNWLFLYQIYRNLYYIQGPNCNWLFLYQIVIESFLLFAGISGRFYAKQAWNAGGFSCMGWLHDNLLAWSTTPFWAVWLFVSSPEYCWSWQCSSNWSFK